MKRNTSWEHVSEWYSKIVGKHGHSYHQELILPKLLPLLEIEKNPSVLDLGCGQGILARNLPAHIEYYGVDFSSSLIKEAQKLSRSKKHYFISGDATQQLSIKKNDFDIVTIILAIQDIDNPLAVFKNAAKHVRKNGHLIVVMNHPCFRVPRQSSWGIDEAKKLQYRRLDAYMQPMQVPISTQPSHGQKSPVVTYFHYPISQYFTWLNDAGFVVENLDEWVSEKESEGKKAKMENRARNEFPLFLYIKAKKV